VGDDTGEEEEERERRWEGGGGREGSRTPTEARLLAPLSEGGSPTGLEDDDDDPLRRAAMASQCAKAEGGQARTRGK
jgi:hypothetical protein